VIIVIPVGIRIMAELVQLQLQLDWLGDDDAAVVD
jgi:hypothetical protein